MTPFTVKLTPVAKVDLDKIKLAHSATLREGFNIFDLGFIISELQIYKTPKVQESVKSSALKYLRNYEGMAPNGCSQRVTERYVSHAPPPPRLRPVGIYAHIYV